jgi:hypothetical protein
MAWLINRGVNALWLKSRPPQHDWKILRTPPQQDCPFGVVNWYVPGNPAAVLALVLAAQTVMRNPCACRGKRVTTVAALGWYPRLFWGGG